MVMPKRFVQTFNSLKAIKATNSRLTDNLETFLLAYRTPHATTGVSPAELMFRRQPRTKLDHNRAWWKTVFCAQSHMQRGSNSKSFVPVEAVWEQMNGTTHRWEAATVTNFGTKNVCSDHGRWPFHQTPHGSNQIRA
ncbi:hypothetical protein FKM82_021994 [Ascaphus truei]